MRLFRKSALRIEKNPEAGTPLSKLGVRAGDIITKIDGRDIKSAADLDRVTENSDLKFLRDNSKTGAASLEDLKF